MHSVISEIFKKCLSLLDIFLIDLARNTLSKCILQSSQILKLTSRIPKNGHHSSNLSKLQSQTPKKLTFSSESKTLVKFLQKLQRNGKKLNRLKSLRWVDRPLWMLLPKSIRKSGRGTYLTCLRWKGLLVLCWNRWVWTYRRSCPRCPRAFASLTRKSTSLTSKLHSSLRQETQSSMLYHQPPSAASNQPTWSLK
jgi:hypothetical protein